MENVNQELEANDLDNVNDSQELETSEAETEVEAGDNDAGERVETQIDRLKAEKAILKGKLEAYESSKSKKGSEKSGNTQEVADIQRLELKFEGVTDSEAQEFVLDYAKTKGFSLSDALSSRTVKAELREMESEKKATGSIPTSSNRTAARDDVSYWVAQYAKGKIAPTTELRRQVRKALKN